MASERDAAWLVETLGQVASARVLDAIAATPRELFVAPRQRHRAYLNRPLRIGDGQTISQPAVVARMTELLALQPDDRVLDIGTGSGWHAAILARLAAHVWSVERHAALSAQAARNLEAAGIENVTLTIGDGSAGLPEHAPFDAINVAATAPSEPVALEQQLAPGGRLVVPVRAEPERLLRVVRGPQGLERTWLEPVRFVPLVEG